MLGAQETEMEHPLVHSKSNPEGLGIACRASQAGPEREFLDEFLGRFRIRVPQGHRVTLFQEPRIESGYPDLVAVVWRATTTEKWHPVRMQLLPHDLRLLHLLVTMGPYRKDEIASLLGRRSGDSLERLEAAQMVRIRGHIIHARALSKLYAVRHIFAIEAKVQEWQSALEQASLNRWFATSSYILLPRVPRGSVVLAQAESMGVGVWSMADTQFDARCLTVCSRPVSYASWLFNEWAWRAENSSPGSHRC